MVNRLELARRFAAAALSERTDGVGALLCGSVARGEDTDTSDVDVAIYVVENTGEGFRELARWEEGVYIEAHIDTTKELGSLDQVMSNPITATRIRDALILDDRTGFFAPLQAQVRSVFMEPRWLRLRTEFALDVCRRNAKDMADFASADDSVGLCDCVWWLSNALPSITLYLAGVTPSSTRKLLQLPSIDPLQCSRVFELECSLTDSAVDFDALKEVCEKHGRLTDNADTGGLSLYMVRKAAWHASRGKLREAIDMLWCSLGVGGRTTAENAAERTALRRSWLLGVGWTTPELVQKKVSLANRLVCDAEERCNAALPEKC